MLGHWRRAAVALAGAMILALGLGAVPAHASSDSAPACEVYWTEPGMPIHLTPDHGSEIRAVTYWHDRLYATGFVGDMRGGEFFHLDSGFYIGGWIYVGHIHHLYPC
jgi:hypothetical protein